MPARVGRSAFRKMTDELQTQPKHDLEGYKVHSMNMVRFRMMRMGVWGVQQHDLEIYERPQVCRGKGGLGSDMV